jgi:hypothetical protein
MALRVVVQSAHIRSFLRINNVAQVGEGRLGLGVPFAKKIHSSPGASKEEDQV